MRLTDSPLDLKPRAIGGCIDLSFLVFGRRLGESLLLWLAFAGPAMLFTGMVASNSKWGWLAALISLQMGTAPLGLCIVAHATLVAFGQQPTLGRILFHGLGDAVPTLLWKWLVRPVIAIGLLFALIPGLAVLARTSFWSEARVIGRLRRHHHEHPTKDLIQQEFSDLLIRLGILFSFAALLETTLIVTVDSAATILFETPLVFGRLAEAVRSPWGYPDFETLIPEMWEFVTTDALLLTTAVGTWMLTYQICRLAWYLVYVDLRIRLDCWDLEVALAEEAERWKAAA